jgi:hypothetical protein
VSKRIVSTKNTMQRISRVALAGVLALAFVGPGGAALAGPPAKGDAAREHFDSAQKLFDQKKYEAALVLFRQAHAASKSPNARLMVARCLLALGRLAEAHDELTATVAEAASRAETEAKYAGARDAAAAELAPLEAKVGKLVLTFATPSPTARVTVNGAAVPAAKLGAPMAVLPGTVEIVAEGVGPDPIKRTETVAAGQTKTIVLGGAAQTAPTATSVTPPDGTATAAPTATGTVPPAGTTTPATTGGGVRVAGFVVAGIGVAGAVLFGVSAAMAQSKHDQLVTECGGARCTDPKYGDVVDSGRTFDLLANIGLGAGIAGLAAGTAMIIFGGPKKAEGAGTATIQITPGGVGIRYEGSF